LSNSIIYLAIPYSHKDKRIENQRYLIVTKLAGYLMKLGHIVYSPITHSHHIARLLDLPKDFDWWKDYCLEMLNRCDELWVVCINGWDKSKGVCAEIDFAKKNNIPIYLLNIMDYLTLFKNICLTKEVG